MKRLIMIAAVLVLFTACNKEENINPVKSGTKLTATLGVGTKTSLDGLNVSWTEGDQMVIYDGSEHTFTADASGASVSISSDDELSGTGTYYGFYPASIFSGISGSTFSGRINGNQQVESGQFWDPLSPIMIGSCEAGAEEITFQNAHALVGITIPANASSISVYSNYGIAGAYAINAQTKEITRTGVELKYISIIGEMAKDNTYYLAALPRETAEADVYVLAKYTSQGGNINSADLVNKPVFYNITIPGVNEDKQTVNFPFNKITRFDLRNATPIGLDGPFTNDNELKTTGSYLLMADDGNAIYTKIGNGNNWDWNNLNLEVYWTDDNTPVVSGAGNKTVHFEQVTGTQNVRIQMLDPRGEGVNASGYWYLAVSSNHSGAFYCVGPANDDEAKARATQFTGYRLHGVVLPH